MEPQKTWRQTTIRVDAELLRKARYFLDREHLSVNEFFIKSLEAYLAEREQDAPLTQKARV